MAGTWWQPDQHRFSGTPPQIRQSVKAGHRIASSSLACIHTCAHTLTHRRTHKGERQKQRQRWAEGESHSQTSGRSVLSRSHEYGRQYQLSLLLIYREWSVTGQAPLIIPSPRAAIYLDTKGHHYGAFFYYENVHFGCSHTVILSGNIMITSEKGFARDWRPQASSALPLCVSANSGLLCLRAGFSLTACRAVCLF